MPNYSFQTPIYRSQKNTLSKLPTKSVFTKPRLIAMLSAQNKENLPQSLCRTIKVHMDLIYPINYQGYDKWIESGYAINLAVGDVITFDGEVVGKWRVVAYDPRSDDAGGRFEFIADDQTGVTLSEEFTFLDYRVSLGLALSNLTRAIEAWHESRQR